MGIFWGIILGLALVFFGWLYAASLVGPILRENDKTRKKLKELIELIEKDDMDSFYEKFEDLYKSGRLD